MSAPHPALNWTVHPRTATLIRLKAGDTLSVQNAQIIRFVAVDDVGGDMRNVVF
jgi:hypothetical protein